MNKVFSNKITVVSVFISERKQYAFGVLLEDDPRTIFIPHTLIKSFGLTEDDINQDFYVLFREQEVGNPLALCISEDPFPLAQSKEYPHDINQPIAGTN